MNNEHLRDALIRTAARTSIVYRTAIISAASLAFVHSLSAQSISINFGSEQGASAITEATKTAGAIPIAGNRWNNTTTAAGTLNGLVDSTGAVTLGSVIWRSPNTYFSASTGATATSENGDLTKGYLDDSSGWEVNVNSPYLLNDIYLIHATDQALATTLISSVNVNGLYYKGNGSATAPATIRGTAAESWSATNWTTADTLTESANYIKVLNQAGVALSALASTPGRAALAGVQVVNTYTGTYSYFDTNAATAGAGVMADGIYTWAGNWSTSALGDVATGAWTAGRAAVFSAGTDGDQLYNVTLSGTQAADAVWIQEGNVALNGGTLDLTAGLGVLRVDADPTGSTDAANLLYLNTRVVANNLSTFGPVVFENPANAITGLVTVNNSTASVIGAQSWNQIAGGGTIEAAAPLTIGASGLSSTFVGSLIGDSPITKAGAGTLTIGKSGTGNGSMVIAGGTLAYDTRLSGETINLSKTITGTGGLNFLGDGTVNTQIIYTSDASLFTGATTINGVRLQLTSAANVFGTGAVNVLAGGQIWGNAAGVLIPNNITVAGPGTAELTGGGGPYGAIRLNSGATVTGNITLNGQSRLGSNAGVGIIRGTITGPTNTVFEKFGAGTLAIESASNPVFPAKTLVDGGILQIATAATIGPVPSAPLADALTLTNGGRIMGGTSIAGADLTITANRGVTLSAGSGGFAAPPGFTTTVSSPIAGAGALYVGAPTGTAANGAVLFNGPSISATAGFVGQVGSTTLSVPTASFGLFNLGDGATNGHTITQTTGAVTSAAQVLLGHWASETSRYNISAGSLSLPDTVTTPTSQTQANLFIGIDGSGILNISGTGVVNTSSLVINGKSESHHQTSDGATPPVLTTVDPDTLNLTGGRLNIGRHGIRTMGTTYRANLGNGILGAYADWSSSLRLDFNSSVSSATDTVINTLDSVDNVTPRTITLSGPLNGFEGGGFVKQGAGTLVLNSTTPGTLLRAGVSGGTLRLVGTAIQGTDVTVNNGGTLAVGTIAAPGAATVYSLNMAGGIAQTRIGATSDVLTVVDTLNLSAPSTVRAAPTGPITGALPQTFPVIKYATLGGDFSNLTFSPANPHLTGTLVNDTTAKQISVQVTAADSLIWKGNVNSTWNVNTTANWALASNGTTASNYFDFDVVRFDDTGLASSTVTLAGVIQPANVVIANTTGTYTFQGAPITGTTSLVKTGAGNLVFLNDNNYGGTSSFTGGNVTLGNGGTTGSFGSGTVTLTDSTLTVNRSNDLTFPASITGTNGTLVKNGAGILTMSAGNNTPNIIVNAGTLAPRGGSFGTGFLSGKTITMNAGTTLSTVTHSLGSQIGGGGTLATLVLNNATWNLANEQYINVLTMTSSTTTGAGEIRAVNSTAAGSTINILPAATPTTIPNNIGLYGNITLAVADGAADVDLAVTGNFFANSLGTGITKTGPGTAVISGGNLYTGPTIISDGVLQIGAGALVGTLGNGGAVTNNATLRFNRSDAVTVANVISGTGTLVKNGAAALTLSAINTYTGNTLVNAGSVVLADNAVLAFAPKANGVSNKITGVGAATISGDFAIDLTGAAIANNNSWTLVDTTTKTFNTSFTVIGFTETNNVHTLTNASGTWTFTEATGALTLASSGTASGYAAYATANNLGTAGPEIDSDGDGIANGIEFVIGGISNPALNSNSSALLPTITNLGTTVRFSFHLTAAAAAVTPKVWSVEMDEDLTGTWTTIVDPTNATITTTADGNGPDGTAWSRVDVVIPKTPAKNFVRLRVNIPTTAPAP